MTNTYLEVTFRKGRPLAAYLYLPRHTGDKVARTDKAEPGLLVDFASDGRPIGVEITSPRQVTLGSVNRVLASLRQDLATPDDLAPLAVA